MGRPVAGGQGRKSGDFGPGEIAQRINGMAARTQQRIAPGSPGPGPGETAVPVPDLVPVIDFAVEDPSQETLLYLGPDQVEHRVPVQHEPDQRSYPGRSDRLHGPIQRPGVQSGRFFNQYVLASLRRQNRFGSVQIIWRGQHHHVYGRIG